MNDISLEERISLYKMLTEDIVPIEVFDYLTQNQYFMAPASSKYHGCHVGGLFDHSVNVAKNLLALTDSEKLVWQHPRSPIVIGLFHDLCKIDQYLYDEHSKKWVWNQRQAILGHGDKSVKLLSTIITDLTEEEKNCILYHMGAFTDQSSWSSYTSAIHIHENVLWTHVADMMATHIDEVER